MGQSTSSLVAGTGPVRWGEYPVRPSTDTDDFILPVGTVTLLLADIEGSSRLWETEREAMTAADARYRELVADAVGKHAGVRPLDQGEGDSFVAAFARASDALACAQYLQRTIATDDAICFRVRMALHTGEVQLRDDVNYIGGVINRTARLREIAHGGQTLISRATHDLVADTLPTGVTLRELGTHRLRDLARPEDVFQLCHADLPDEFPPLRSLDAYPNNLPAQLTTFIGRHDELAAVSKLLNENRLLTLTGAGGCGKTRLALQSAAAATDRFADGAWFCDLAPVTQPDMAASAVASALGISEEPGRTVTETIVEHLAPKRVLLVLDNCEHLIEVCAEIADVLLRGCSDLTVLATSREPLRVEGEVAWRVPSLSIPEAQDAVAIETLADFDAVRLFVDRATRVRPTFSVTDENASAVAQICRRLEGIPLAIELASAMVRVMPPEQIASGLDDRFRVLGAGPRTALPRHQTLRASVDWSFDLLSDGERVLLRRLSVFAGGFTLEGAEAVCGTDPLDAYAVLPTLSTLVDKSLVLADEGRTEARYRMLETIKQYGNEHLIEAGEEIATRDRHLDHLRAFIETVEPSLTAGAPTTIGAIGAELDNLRAGLEWAVASGQADAGLWLCGSMTTFWYMAGHLPEASRHFEQLLGLDGRSSPEALGRALFGAALFKLVGSGEVASAAAMAEQALEAARAADDRLFEGRALYVLGYVALSSSANDQARAYLAEALKICAETNDAFFKTDAPQTFGYLEVNTGDLSAARAYFDETYARAVAQGNAVHQAEACYAAAFVAILAGNIVEGRSLAQRSVEISRGIGHPFMESYGLGVQVLAALAHGDITVAKATAPRAVQLYMEAGASNLLPVQSWLGRVLLAAGDLDDAVNVIVPFIEQWDVIGLRQYFGSVAARSDLAEALLRLGRAGEAAPVLDEALQISTENGNGYDRARVLYVAALLARSRQDEDQAESVLHDALLLQVDAGDRPGVCDTLEAIAGIAASQESYAEAARLFGAAQAMRDEMEYARYPVRQPEYDADVALLVGVEDAWEEGSSMSLQDAVAYASRGRGERKRPSSGWASLTPTEVEVVRLAAQGLSNPQIAEKLFISKHTVKVHVSHVFAKLGIGSRAELASEATRRGL